MSLSKVYAHVANGAKSLIDGEWQHECIQFFNEQVIFQTKDNCFFVGIPAISGARELLAEVPGVTVLDSIHSPHPIKAEHHALLAKHGVVPTDTAWHAIEKVHATFGKPAGLFDPHV